jgi:hypothetical protein
MTPGATERFDRPWLLLCEGPGDQRFFERLFETHNIGQDFSIRFPHREGKWNGGRSAFGNDLKLISVGQSFIDEVKAILIISDNDSDPAKSFAEVQAELQKAGFGVPPAERIISRKAGYPHVVALMLPIGKLGNLETLCLEAAHSKWGLKAELDTFVASSPAKDWSQGKQSKMRIQTMLAATNSNQPDCGFTGHWKQPAEFQIPLDHPCFNVSGHLATHSTPRVNLRRSDLNRAGWTHVGH